MITYQRTRYFLFRYTGLMEFRSLPSLARSLSRIYGPKPAVQGLIDGVWKELNWLEVWAGARSLALGLLAEGFEPGQTAVVISDDTPAALQAELGIQAAGGRVCRVYPGTEGVRVSALIRDKAARHVFVAAECRPGFAEVIDALPPPVCRELQEAAPDAADRESLDRFSDDPALEDRLNAVGPDSPVLLLSKEKDWVELLQSHLLNDGLAVARELEASEIDTWLTFGPLSTPLIRVAGFSAALVSCGQLCLSRPGTDLMESLWSVKPSVVLCHGAQVPALLERFTSEVESMAGFNGHLTRWAWGILLRGRDDLLTSFARWAGLFRLQDVVGGRLRALLTFGPRPSPDTIRLLDALAVTTCHLTAGDGTTHIVNVERFGVG